MNENEPTLEEEMQQRLSTLPGPVREYLTKGGIENTARTMTARYSLHVDQGAVLMRELLLVLMGIEQPAELAQALQDELNLSPDQINSLLTDINTGVFQPLQDQMRTPAAPSATVPTTVQPQPVSVPTPVATNEPVHTARVVAPPANLPGADVQEPNIGMPQAVMEPNVVVYAAPAPVPAPVNVPQTVPPAPVAPAPVSTPTAAAITRVAAPVPQESARPLLKQYGVDPYKEPIE